SAARADAGRGDAVAPRRDQARRRAQPDAECRVADLGILEHAGARQRRHAAVARREADKPAQQGKAQTVISACAYLAGLTRGLRRRTWPPPSWSLFARAPVQDLCTHLLGKA